MTMIRIALACTLWLCIVAVAAGILLWRVHHFDVINSSHWRYLGAGISLWLTTGQSIRSDFLAILIATPAIALCGAWGIGRLTSRHGARFDGALIAALSSFLRRIKILLLWLLRAPFKILLWLLLGILRMITPKGERSVAVAGGEFSWPEPPPTREMRLGRVSITLNGGEEPDSAGEGVIRRAARPLNRVPPAAAVPPPAMAPPQPLPASGLGMGDDSDDDVQTGEVMTDHHVRAAVTAWLTENGQGDLFHYEVAVDGDLGGNFAEDNFDGDATATIPLVMVTAASIHLINAVSLQNHTWIAEPWDPDRIGLPLWFSTDGVATMPCPISASRRMRSRFLSHHEQSIESAGIPFGGVMAVVVFDCGDIANLDEVEDSWKGGGVDVVHLMGRGALESLFGTDIPALGDPHLVRAINKASADLARGKRSGGER
jgi:hypothetical protein